MKSYVATCQPDNKEWFVVDAQGKTLGRLASHIASVLRGKHKPTYTPHVDAGDFVVVVNADKVRLTGKKMDVKMYWWHTGFPGGIRGRNTREMLATRPEEVLMSAIRGMLPKNPLGRKMIDKVKIYATPDHPHAAQQPKPLDYN